MIYQTINPKECAPSTHSHLGFDSTRVEPEADAPVPDRLLPKWKNKYLLSRLKLSQMIGLLLFLNRRGTLSEGGKERLLYLQSRASFEALEAGLKFAQRLFSEKKLQSDFQHQLVELNRRPQSKRFRKYEVSRIGVGYRDKGTLPEVTSSGRGKALEESFVYMGDLPRVLTDLIISLVPSSIEGEWLDPEILSQGLRSLDFENPELTKLLNLL